MTCRALDRHSMRVSLPVRTSPASDVLPKRLSQLASLSEEDVSDLRRLASDPHKISARLEIVHEGDPITMPQALLGGWAYRQRILADGRRQILSFVLPGDLIGSYRLASPTAETTVVAINDVLACALPAMPRSPAMAEAFARSDALEKHHLYAQITRMGRLDARERVADWLLETYERLAFAGIASDHRFELPITQEMLADALGVTSVHVNRTLQGLRQDGLITLRQGLATLLDRDRLARMVDYKPHHIRSDET